MKKLLIVSLIVIGFTAKAQTFKVEPNKVIQSEVLAEIKSDTLIVYKDLEKVVKLLNKHPNHKSFKFIVLPKNEFSLSGTIKATEPWMGIYDNKVPLSLYREN